MPDATAPLLVVSTTDQTPETALELLRQKCGWQGSELEHPALHWFDGRESGLKIEDVRNISELLGFQPVGDATYIIVLALENASVPAQQALLKMLEEPPAFARWLLLTSNLNQILPTIQSRCLVIEDQSDDATLSGDVVSEMESLYEKICSSSIGEAIALSDTFGDRSQTQKTLKNLITYLHQLPPTAEKVKHLQILVQTASWAAANVNLKLALGECFLRLRTS